MTIYRVTVSGLYHQQNIQNVFNWKYTGGAIPSETALMTDLRANWLENLRFLQNIEFNYTGLSAQQMLPQVRNPVALVVNDKPGTLAGTGYHCAIAAIFSFKTLNPTRKGRGRYFMGGVHAASVDHSLMQSGAFNQYVATAAILTARYCAGTNSGWTLQVGPRTYQSEADYKDVQQIIPKNYFGLIHSRNVNVGG